MIITPEVKEVLSSVHSITGRRVAGDDAVSFIRNPYTFIGEDAASVIPPEQHEKALQDAHIFSTVSLLHLCLMMKQKESRPYLLS